MTAQPTNAAAEQVMARAGKTFYQASRLLPAKLRADVASLYAFCRTVDDLADEPGLPVEERRSSLHRLLACLEAADEQELTRYGWLLGSDAHRLRGATILVQAALGDLEQCQPLTDNDVLAYAFGVAGSVGLLMADVLQARHEGLGAAVSLGCAMQLSNICRDVAEDYRNGRVYLPAQAVPAAMLRAALTRQDPAARQAVRTCTRGLLLRAEELYQAAYDGMWTLPWRVRWSILAAAMCYREIGVQVGQDIDRSWRTRTVVGLGRKLQLIASASLRLLLPRYWLPRSRPVWPPCLGGLVLAQAQQWEAGR